MIYLDNAATTFPKPKKVIDSLVESCNNFTSPSRGSYDLSKNSSKMVFLTRKKVANFFGVSNPLLVAFTSNVTESINLVINSIFTNKDHIITTTWEHNSVIRPLYNNGIDYDCLTLKNDYSFDYSKLPTLLKKNTKAVICSHGSNILGNLVDLKEVSNFCKKNNLLFILDVAQTAGIIPIDLIKDNIDILCFTGHKSLYSITGVGGICVNPNLDLQFNLTKTGGTGYNSLKIKHNIEMPECFEAGTMNFVGINSLNYGIDFIEEIGINNIREKEEKLMNLAYNELIKIEGIKVYGDFSKTRTPVISFTYGKVDCGEIASILWEDYKIALREGFHCCPLIHKNIGTLNTGILRISFSYFNEESEVYCFINAIKKICTS